MSLKGDLSAAHPTDGEPRARPKVRWRASVKRWAIGRIPGDPVERVKLAAEAEPTWGGGIHDAAVLHHHVKCAGRARHQPGGQLGLERRASHHRGQRRRAPGVSVVGAAEAKPGHPAEPRHRSSLEVAEEGGRVRDASVNTNACSRSLIARAKDSRLSSAFREL